jgi:dTDP-3-amino-3,6-dideoxy-alpha-D-glucopyranose N,N-dimethyltransferase/dTDP-3-amino-3,4,6-trideoxy-alpha-D-glucopyranose N,N-dimethyltransferase/N-methyltransferase
MYRGTAHVYDLIYTAAGKDYGKESEDIHDLIQQRSPSARTLLDVACGTGGHLSHLQRYYDVVGIDIDPGMLEQARTRMPDAQLIEADMRSFRLHRAFDVVVCLFSSIGYMASTIELDTTVANMVNHLNARGILIVDGWVLPEEWKGAVGTTISTAVTDTLKVVRMIHATREDRATRLEMHHLVASDNGIDYIVDHHRLTLFMRHEYQAAFHRAGLRVDTTDSPIHGRDRYIGQQSQLA